MLRFVQGIQKAFRSNQAYAPCQKAAHDQDELDGRAGDCIPPQRRSYGDLASVPLSQPLPEGAFGEDTERCNGQDSTHKTESHFTGSAAPPSLVTGAILGAGCVVFKSVHAYCSGRGVGSSSDRTKYCPATQYQHVQRSGVLLKALTNLAGDALPNQSYNARSRLSVLPKSSLRQAIVHSPDISVAESVDERALRQKEFEKAQDQVNALADKLSNVDEENLAADHFRAMRAWNSKDFVSAANLWQRIVDKFATPIAAHRLGIIYEHGHGVAKDYQQASAYYQQAISHQCSRAMYRQAMLQMNGLVEGDTDSVELMKQSAELGYSKAQVFLGTANFHGGKKELAVKYYKQAAAQDDWEACYYLGICYETGAGLAANDSKAAEYYLRAAEGGHAAAQFNLAMFYEEGCGGLDVDEERSSYWLAKSAKQGNKDAKNRLKQLGPYSLAPSASLPAMSRHLSNTLSDMAVHDMPRTYSATSLTPQQASSVIRNGFSQASSTSSMAGTPQFYISKGADGDDSQPSFGDWSDEGLSSASSSSLRLDPQHDKFSVEFALEKTSFDPSLYPLHIQDSWKSYSASSLYRPDHEGPEVTFA